MKFKEVLGKGKAFVKEHKKEIIMVSVGGVLVGVSYVLGKKVQRSQMSVFSHQFADIVRDISVDHSDVDMGFIAKNHKEIDEDVFVNIASDIEDYLCDLKRDEKVLMEKWYDVAENTHKMLKIEMNTVYGD